MRFEIRYRRPLSLTTLGCCCCMILAFVFLSSSCQKPSAPEPKTRAHLRAYSGVFHADPALTAERYCQDCHGLNLVGGEGKIPSCYSCHGKNWLDDSPDSRRAPDDHNVLQEKWYHHPAMATPTGNCDVCHGIALEGEGQQGPPSCLLCHQQLWP